jgi:pimeloyl-ACP methyl ester carboxylesterase
MLADWKSDYKGSVERMTREHLFTPNADQNVVQTVVAHMTAMRPDIATAMINGLFRYDLAKRLEGLDVPIHFINASALGPTDMEAIGRHAKKADLQLIDGVGHFPMLEAPAPFDKALDAAIAGKVPSPKS